MIIWFSFVGNLKTGALRRVKITFAVAVVTPFVKEGNASIYMGILVSGTFLLGTYIIYQGAKKWQLIHLW